MYHKLQTVTSGRKKNNNNNVKTGKVIHRFSLQEGYEQSQ